MSKLYVRKYYLNPPQHKFPSPPPSAIPTRSYKCIGYYVYLEYLSLIFICNREDSYIQYLAPLSAHVVRKLPK